MNKVPKPNKIQASQLPRPILHRDALVRSIADALGLSNNGQKTSLKLILLCAPAGYGKTTLLVDTIQQYAITCCWYFLEDSDTPAIFLEVLLASIRNCFPTFGTHLDTLLSGQEAEAHTQKSWMDILDALINALQEEISQHFSLAFCNYHQVKQNGIINDLINHLLVRLPQQGVVIIESRSLPNLNLASLIASRQIFGLGSNRLRFSTQELCELSQLQGFGTFSLQEAEYVATSFDGWIAGILLGSRLGYTQMQPLFPAYKRNGQKAALLADRQQIFTYIVNEVFRQETATFEFLEAVSIFDQLMPKHCNMLLEINDAAERLIYAEQQGLFVIRSEELSADDGTGIYTCHPILRELLRENLRRHSFQRYLMLNRRAAHFLQNESALMHALQAQEYQIAVAIMMRIAPSFTDRGDWETIAHWLDLLPQHVIKQDPWLLLIQANLRLAQNEYANVSSLLDTAEVLLETASPEHLSLAHASLQSELLLARSTVLFSQGEFSSAQELCQQILDILPMSEHRLRIQTYQRLGTCFIVGNGCIHEGISQLQYALQLSRSQKEELQTAILHRLLAGAYGWIGNYTLADHHQTRSLQIWEKLGEPRGIINSLTSVGLLRLRQGLTQKAEEIFTRALHLARGVYSFISGQAYALAALGELCCTVGRYAQALTYLEDGLRLAQQCEDRYLTHCNLFSLATAYLFMGEIQTGQFFLNQVILNEQAKHGFEGLSFCLTQGRLYLAQPITYIQAQRELERAVSLGKETNIQFLHLQAHFLLAVCCFRQQKASEARQIIEGAIALNKKGDFEHIFKVEAVRYPELQVLLDQVVPEGPAGQAISLQVSEEPFQEPPPLSVKNGGFPGDQNKNGTYRLHILAFGEPKVLIDETLITRWHMTRSLELFFFLLEHAHPVQKDQIIETLWSDSTIEQIDTGVRTAIYYLRRAIGKECIVYRSGFYSLNLSAVYEEQVCYDVDMFEKHYTNAKKNLKAGNEEEANMAFTTMVEMYKGDYMQSFYSNWCIAPRERLRQAYLDARQQLALIAWRGEHWEESLQHWQHILAIDSCFEKAHYGLMRCYLQLGKRELALRQYQRCCQNLQEGLQTTPSPFTRRLHQKIIGISE